MSAKGWYLYTILLCGYLYLSRGRRCENPQSLASCLPFGSYSAFIWTSAIGNMACVFGRAPVHLLGHRKHSRLNAALKRRFDQVFQARISIVSRGENEHFRRDDSDINQCLLKPHAAKAGCSFHVQNGLWSSTCCRFRPGPLLNNARCGRRGELWMQSVEKCSISRLVDRVPFSQLDSMNIEGTQRVNLIRVCSNSPFC
eukprot:1212411-Pleurochrysis_carterae.AAC.4